MRVNLQLSLDNWTCRFSSQQCRAWPCQHHSHNGLYLTLSPLPVLVVWAAVKLPPCWSKLYQWPTWWKTLMSRAYIITTKKWWIRSSSLPSCSKPSGRRNKISGKRTVAFLLSFVLFRGKLLYCLFYYTHNIIKALPARKYVFVSKVLLIRFTHQ